MRYEPANLVDGESDNAVSKKTFTQEILFSQTLIILTFVFLSLE